MEEIKEQKKEENINIEKKDEEKMEIKKEQKSNNTTNNIEIFVNINSPQEIQDILHQSTHSSKINLELENNIIKSFQSINNINIDILDNDIEYYKYNPYIIIQNKKNNLYKLNFEDVNITNYFLNKKINQYKCENPKNSEISEKTGKKKKRK